MQFRRDLLGDRVDHRIHSVVHRVDDCVDGTVECVVNLAAQIGQRVAELGERVIDELHPVSRQRTQTTGNSSIDRDLLAASKIEGDIALHVQELAGIHQYVVGRGMNATAGIVQDFGRARAGHNVIAGLTGEIGIAEGGEVNNRRGGSHALSRRQIQFNLNGARFKLEVVRPHKLESIRTRRQADIARRAAVGFQHRQCQVDVRDRQPDRFWIDIVLAIDLAVAVRVAVRAVDSEEHRQSLGSNIEARHRRR